MLPRVQTKHHTSLAMRTWNDLGTEEPCRVSRGYSVLYNESPTGVCCIVLSEARVEAAVAVTWVFKLTLG
jgi:hypothetical protein